ncbi:YgjV family protein [Kosakonia sp. R1.Fl]|uniref:YgjV family protein n=1 Tax=Kosakonia sp. R1.Fl TaxID=2928706 RepID=UPI00201DDF28|nr:YgjV family protein [Kosakonia sp. R1.Fl]MCL6743326.1 YgjV family protein [Kosakonia sp. R1.Fl]
MMSAFWLSQMLAGFSFIFDLLAFQFARRRITLAILAASTSLLAVHFCLLNAPVAASLMALAACRYLTAIMTTARKMKNGFIVATCLCSALSWQHSTDVLPLLGSLLMTSAAFHPAAKSMRRLTLCGSGCWLVNNMVIGSPVAVAMESAFILSTLVSYWRLTRQAE